MENLGSKGIILKSFFVAYHDTTLMDLASGTDCFYRHALLEHRTPEGLT
jgi:hypothetical protein